MTIRQGDFFFRNKAYFHDSFVGYIDSWGVVLSKIKIYFEWEIYEQTRVYEYKSS